MSLTERLDPIHKLNYYLNISLHTNIYKQPPNNGGSQISPKSDSCSETRDI